MPLSELDRQLESYFKAALPQTWPPLHLPQAEPARPRRKASASHGRVTLAASVALLLGLGISLTSEAPLNGPTPKAPGHGVDVKNPQANGKNLLPREAVEPAPMPLP
jgi:hypothetical protein